MRFDKLQCGMGSIQIDEMHVAEVAIQSQNELTQRERETERRRGHRSVVMQSRFSKHIYYLLRKD